MKLVLPFNPRVLPQALVGGWVIITMLIVLYALKPQYQTYRNQLNSEHLLALAVNHESQLKSEIESTQKDLADLRQRLKGERGNLSPKKMESFIISRLQDVSWDKQVKVMSIRPGAVNKVLGFDEVSFDVVINGKFENLYDWLIELQEKLGFISIKSYEISTTGGTADTDLLTMKLTIVIYEAPGP